VATALSPTQVNLVWQDTSTTEDGFQIERRGGSSADFSQIGVVAADATSFIDTTALTNTAYAYRLRAFNNAGTSDFTSAASVITPTTAPVLTVETASLADATVSVPYSRSLVASGGGTTYSWLVESGQLPPGLSLAQSGTLSGTPTSAGTYNFVTRVSDGSNSATKALTLDSAAHLTYRAAWLRDTGANVTREAAMAKLAATEGAQQVIDAAVQLWGGRGVQSGETVERLYREIRALRIYEGASEVQQLIIGRDLLKAHGNDRKDTT
jgi:hypothetical protein